jgi:Arc/MetJ family transcription regulator
VSPITDDMNVRRMTAVRGIEAENEARTSKQGRHKRRFGSALPTILPAMRRITVNLDDELVARVMKRYGLKTKREAIDFALRRAAGLGSYEPAELMSLEGIGWEGDLRKMRRTRYPSW